MFRTEEEINVDAFQAAAQVAERNYKIKRNDILQFRVTPNKGEVLTDPYGQFRQQLVLPNSAGATRMQQNQAQEFEPQYYVDPKGEVKLPMVGYVKVEGLTLYQADSVLNEKYSEFYVEPFVLTTIQNRRVLVLGAIGGQVVPLPNENTTLIEVLAMVGGVSSEGRARNIRLIRGDLDNPSVQVIDLSTIEGMMQANLNVQPNDIVYVEPVYRIVPQAIGDFSPILGLFTSVLTLIVIFSR